MTLPDLAVGATFTVYNVLGPVGLDGSVLGMMENIDGTKEHIIDFGLAVNVELPWVPGLYPGLGLIAILNNRQTTSFKLATKLCPAHHGSPTAQS